MAVEFEVHYWYVVVRDTGRIVGIVGQAQSGKGVQVYDTLEEWENAF